MTQPALPVAPLDSTVRLEEWAAATVTAKLRRALQEAARLITALYVILAGGVDRPLPQGSRRLFADEAARIIARVRFQDRDELWALVKQALALGARDAAVSGAVAAAAAVRPEVEDWIGNLVGTIVDRVLAVLSSAQAAPQIGTPPANYRDVVQTLALANRALSLVERDTRWAVNAAHNQGITEAANDAGVPRVWVAERDACLHCLAYAGQVAQPGQPYPTGLTFYIDPRGNLKPLSHDPVWGPPLHPNCVPAGTIVSGPEVEIAYRRWYTGKMVEVRTQGGHVLSVTPNHPVLTDAGWVPAGGLHAGSYVVCRSRGPAITSSPNEDQEPALIEQVFGALRMALGVAAVGVAVTAEDFHGDGGDGQVDIVPTRRFLDRRVEVAEPLSEEHLVGSSRGGLRLSGLGGPLQQVGRSGAPDNPPASRHRAGHALFGGLVCGDDPVGFGVAADGDAGFVQDAGDDGAALPLGGTDLLDTLTGQVALDQVVEVWWYPFEGHVYNLQTVDGWYNANGIVTHNCRCSQELDLGSENYPVMPWETAETSVSAALKREAKRAVLKGKSGSDSLPARLRAVDSLLVRADGQVGLPKSVVQRARDALVAGRFG